MPSVSFADFEFQNTKFGSMRESDTEGYNTTAAKYTGTDVQVTPQARCIIKVAEASLQYLKAKLPLLLFPTLQESEETFF